MKTTMQELIKWMDDNKSHCTYGTIRGKATELLQSYASHPSPMSAEQVEELAEKYASEEFDKHSFSEFKGAENSLWENRKADFIAGYIEWENRKHNFIAGYNAATTPSVKAEGWVNIYEDIQGRYIGDSEYSSYQEALDERDELSTYLETVQISRLPAPPKQQL